MKEVVLNDECMHCNNRECHDGEHFCNQAMKDNSFYKNARLYKGLEVIQRPTYEELEKENAGLKDDNKVMADNYSKMEQKFYDNLTKAEEILRSLYFIIESRIDYKNNIGIADEMWRAKQFLRMVEK